MAGELFQLTFFVPGIPRPGGSKKVFAHSKTKKIMVTEAGKYTKQWRDDVAKVARQAYTGQPVNCALCVWFTFQFQRPKSHFRTGKNKDVLKDNAPKFHTIKPDTTKLIRSAEDALTGIIWKDDAQIMQQGATKKYAVTNAQQGMWISISEAK